MLEFKEKEFLITNVNYNGNYVTLCFKCIRITGSRNNRKEASATYALFDKNGEVIGESVDIIKQAGYSEEEIQKYIDYYKKYHKVLNSKESFHNNSSKMNNNQNPKYGYNPTILNNIKRCNNFDELAEICSFIYKTYGDISKYSGAIAYQVRTLFSKDPNLNFYKEKSNYLFDERVYPFLFKMMFVISIRDEKERFDDVFNNITRDEFAKQAFDYMMYLFFRVTKMTKNQLSFFEIIYSSFSPFNYSISALDQIYNMSALYNFSYKMSPFLQEYKNEILNYTQKIEGYENNINYFTIMENSVLIDPFVLTKAKATIKNQDELDKWNYFKKRYEVSSFDEKSYILSRKYLIGKNEQNLTALTTLINCIDNKEILYERRLDRIHSKFYVELPFYLIYIEENIDEIILEINQLYFKYSSFYSDSTREQYNEAMKKLISKKGNRKI